jgi:hypothetical protein
LLRRVTIAIVTRGSSKRGTPSQSVVIAAFEFQIFDIYVEYGKVNGIQVLAPLVVAPYGKMSLSILVTPWCDIHDDQQVYIDDGPGPVNGPIVVMKCGSKSGTTETEVGGETFDAGFQSDEKS